VYVVYFHDVMDGVRDAFDGPCGRITRETFERVVSFLTAHFSLVSLDEALGRADDHRVVTVTFDDGYAGVLEHAAPVLERAGVPAAVFVVSGTLGDADAVLHYEELELMFRSTTVSALALPELGMPALTLDDPKTRVRCLKRVQRALRERPDRERRALHEAIIARLGVDRKALRALPQQRKLTPAGLHALAARGWTIGAHTRTHRALGRLSEAEAREEIAGSRADLADALGNAPRYLAYPYGLLEDIGEVAPRLAQAAGYEAAFTTMIGPVDRSANRYLLRRLEFIELIGLQDDALQAQARAAFGR